MKLGWRANEPRAKREVSERVKEVTKDTWLLGKTTGPSFDFLSLISPWLERRLNL